MYCNIFSVSIGITMPFSRKSRLVASSKNKQASSEQETFLFVVKSIQATSVKISPRTYHLNIPIGLSKKQIVAFSDRPFRDAFIIDVQAFVSNWNSGSSFGKDPPNAVVDFLDPQTRGRESALVGEITDAKLVKNNQILQLTVTQGNFRNTDESLGNTLKPMMNCVNVFIDSGATCTGNCASLMPIWSHRPTPTPTPPHVAPYVPPIYLS
jgi:hypothetical protein